MSNFDADMLVIGEAPVVTRDCIFAPTGPTSPAGWLKTPLCTLRALIATGSAAVCLNVGCIPVGKRKALGYCTWRSVRDEVST